MDGKTGTAGRNVVVFECIGTPAADGASATAQRPQPGPSLSEAQTIRVPCSGKLQPEHLLKAFEAGADLVVVLACGNGDCRYLEGRSRIERRVEYVRGLLDEIGLGGERLLLLDRSNGPAANGGWRTLDNARDLAPSPLGSSGNGKG